MPFTPAVGEKVIIVHGDRNEHLPPEVRLVTSVTPSGQFAVEGIEGRFSSRRFQSHEAKMRGTGRYGGGTKAHRYDASHFKRLTDGHNDWLAEQQRNRDERDERRKAIERRDDERRAYVRAMIDIEAHRTADLPTGHRVYVFPDLHDRGDRDPGTLRYATIITGEYEGHDLDDGGKLTRLYRAEYTVWRGAARHGRGFHGGTIEDKRTEWEAVIDALVVAIFEIR